MPGFLALIFFVAFFEPDATFVAFVTFRIFAPIKSPFKIKINT